MATYRERVAYHLNGTRSNNMSNNELAALNKLSNYHLRLARKGGELCITETKLGNLELDYDSDSKTYTVTVLPNWRTCGPDACPELLISGKAGPVRAALEAAYSVES